MPAKKTSKTEETKKTASKTSAAKPAKPAKTKEVKETAKKETKTDKGLGPDKGKKTAPSGMAKLIIAITKVFTRKITRSDLSDNDTPNM